MCMTVIKLIVKVVIVIVAVVVIVVVFITMVIMHRRHRRGHHHFHGLRGGGNGKLANQGLGGMLGGRLTGKMGMRDASDGATEAIFFRGHTKIDRSSCQ